MFVIGIGDHKSVLTQIKVIKNQFIHRTNRFIDILIYATTTLTSTVGELLTLVQAKCYDPKRPIGLEPVAALSAVVNQEGAHRGLLVTTSRFLPGAKEFALQHQQRLELATADEVAQWCEEITRRKIGAGLR